MCNNNSSTLTAYFWHSFSALQILANLIDMQNDEENKEHMEETETTRAIDTEDQQLEDEGSHEKPKRKKKKDENGHAGKKRRCVAVKAFNIKQLLKNSQLLHRVLKVRHL